MAVSELVARTAAVSTVGRGAGRTCMLRIMVVAALVDPARLALGAGSRVAPTVLRVRPVARQFVVVRGVDRVSRARTTRARVRAARRVPNFTAAGRVAASRDIAVVSFAMIARRARAPAARVPNFTAAVRVAVSRDTAAVLFTMIARRAPAVRLPNFTPAVRVAVSRHIAAAPVVAIGRLVPVVRPSAAAPGVVALG